MKDLIKTTKIIILALIVVLGASYVYAWTGPTQAPTDGNTSAPINVSNVPQYKDGALSVGGIFRAYSNAIFDGNMGIRTASPSTGGEQNLNLDVEGAVGAQWYCDEDGNNCVAGDSIGTGGGGSSLWELIGGTYLKPISTSQIVHVPYKMVLGSSVSNPAIVMETVGNSGWIEAKGPWNGIKSDRFCMGSDCITEWGGGGGGSSLWEADSQGNIKTVGNTGVFVRDNSGNFSWMNSDNNNGGHIILSGNRGQIIMAAADSGNYIDTGSQGEVTTRTLCLNNVCRDTWPSGGGGNVTYNDTLADLSCSTDQIAKWNGSAWACAANGGGGGNVKVASGQDVVGPSNVENLAIIDLANHGFDINGSEPHIIVSQHNYNRRSVDLNTMDASYCGFDKLSKLEFEVTCWASPNNSDGLVDSTFDWLAIQN